MSLPLSTLFEVHRAHIWNRSVDQKKWLKLGQLFSHRGSVNYGNLSFKLCYQLWLKLWNIIDTQNQCVCFELYINPNLSFQQFWRDKPWKAEGCNVLFKIETLLKIHWCNYMWVEALCDIWMIYIVDPFEDCCIERDVGCANLFISSFSYTPCSSVHSSCGPWK